MMKNKFEENRQVYSIDILQGGENEYNIHYSSCPIDNLTSFGVRRSADNEFNTIQ